MADDIICLAILETGERKKLTLKEGDCDEVVTALTAYTNITDSTLIQIYDDILEDFIDVEPNTVVQHKGKVKVSRRLLPMSDDCTSRPVAHNVTSPSSTCMDSDSDTPRMPSKQLYRTAVERLLTKYPHLKDEIEDQSGMDCSHLVVSGETADSVRLHYEWLKTNGSCSDEDSLRPRLMATAQDRHERLKSMTLSEALVAYPFLATEVSLLVEFEMLFQRGLIDCIKEGCTTMEAVVIEKGLPAEAVAFSEVAAEQPVLGILQFIAGRCKEPLQAILSPAIKVHILHKGDRFLLNVRRSSVKRLQVPLDRLFSFFQEQPLRQESKGPLFISHQRPNFSLYEVVG
ncbi:hypothetical protein MTO96_022549 [Rhipicephalus appendiculatus]